MRLENDRYTENEIKKMPNWAECLWQTAPKQLDLRKYFGSKNYEAILAQGVAAMSEAAAMG